MMINRQVPGVAVHQSNDATRDIPLGTPVVHWPILFPVQLAFRYTLNEHLQIPIKGGLGEHHCDATTTAC